MDRSAVITLGVRWPLTGDDNFNATVTVRYRTGAGAFRNAMPLFRVHAELVAPGVAPSGLSMAPHLRSGSLRSADLAPPCGMKAPSLP
jgi:hypothetical protein